MQNLSLMLIKASRLLKNKMDHALKEFDITAVQFSVIKQILTSEEPITAAEIAQYLGSDRPTISEILHRLENKGIIIKVDNPTDKRSCYLQVDKEADQLVGKISMISDSLTAEIFSIYTEEEITQLSRMINNLIDGAKE